MYEYLSEIERWKSFDDIYKDKYSKIKKFSENCENDCKKSKISEEEINSCKGLCKKPIIDIERNNMELNKRITLDIYDLCTNKAQEINNINSKVSKIKSCVENLFRDNELIIKKEMINRIDDMINFLKI